jgi:hypothetical protein
MSYNIGMDPKGLKLQFTCSDCNEVVCERYLLDMLEEIKDKKCLSRLVNGTLTEEFK